MGLTSVMCGAISFANDPFFAYIISSNGLNRNFRPVDVSFLRNYTVGTPNKGTPNKAIFALFALKSENVQIRQCLI